MLATRNMCDQNAHCSVAYTYFNPKCNTNKLQDFKKNDLNSGLKQEQPFCDFSMLHHFTKTHMGKINSKES